MHVIAAKAVAFGEALKPDFKTYQENVIENAKILSKTLEDRGFRIVTGGTDTHVVLVDVGSKNIKGNEAEKSLGKQILHVTRMVFLLILKNQWLLLE